LPLRAQVSNGLKPHSFGSFGVNHLLFFREKIKKQRNSRAGKTLRSTALFRVPIYTAAHSFNFLSCCMVLHTFLHLSFYLASFLFLIHTCRPERKSAMGFFVEF
jgi:hypothetical protein